MNHPLPNMMGSSLSKIKEMIDSVDLNAIQAQAQEAAGSAE